MSSVQEQMKIMVSLQKREISIRRLEADLAGTDERINALNEELSSYQALVDEQEKTLADIRKIYRSNEDEIKMIEAQIGKSKEKLNAVKTNKEYQSMLKEIDDLNVKSSGIEDQMLEALDRIEAYEKDLVERKADLADAQSDISQKQEEIRRKAEGQQSDLEALKVERDGIQNRLEDGIQKIYEKAKRQSKGIALAAIVDGICQACRINIPPQLFNELRRMDSLRMCPNCQRIMYPQVAFEEEQEAI